MTAYAYFTDVPTQLPGLARATWLDGVWSARVRLTINGVSNHNLVDPDIQRTPDGRYVLYYRDEFGANAIFSAVSDDGINFVDARAAFTVLTGNIAADPTVVRLLDGSYLMAISQQHTDLVTFFAGTNGRDFAATGVTVNAGGAGQGGANELVQYSDGTLRLFYAGANGIQRMASGDSGLHWAVESGVSLTDPGRFANSPGIMRGSDGLWYMLFQESTDGSSNISASALQIATSTDGINFAIAGRDTLLQSSVPEPVDSAAGTPTYPTGGADVFTSSADNERFDGKGGVDTVVFSQARAQYQLRQSGSSFVVSGPQGTDTLVAIERVQFSDAKLALDLSGAAGNTAKLIGAAFGASYIGPAFNGEGIRLFDQGMSMRDVAELVLNTALFTQLAGSRSNEAVVTALFSHVVGRAPSPTDLNFYTDMLKSGTSQADLLVLAAETAQNALNIDLVGLSASGLQYI